MTRSGRNAEEGAEDRLGSVGLGRMVTITKCVVVAQGDSDGYECHSETLDLCMDVRSYGFGLSMLSLYHYYHPRGSEPDMAEKARVGQSGGSQCTSTVCTLLIHSAHRKDG
jgi:hypothetical protein